MSAPDHKWERRADAALGVAASAILLVLMSLTFVDVVARYVFNRPIRGGFEVTELLLLVLIFAGLPLVSHANEHVTMDFVDRTLGVRARAWLNRIVHLVVAAMMGFMSWQVIVKAGRISSYGDATDVIRIPYAPFVYFMAAMLALAALIHLYKIYDPGPPPGEHAGPQ
jgi:TRAP-type C4-dicarboxylate transport system permease small subunit